MSSSKTNTILSTSEISERKALLAEVAEKERAVKAMNEVAEWEAKTLERNPAYVVGSLRKATAAEAAALGHCHGWVCDIRCLNCGEIRTVNKQDAFQSRFCVACRKTASKEVAKEKRLTKKMAGVTKEDIEKQIAELNALLASKGQPTKKAKRSRKAKAEVAPVAAPVEPVAAPVEAAPTTEVAATEQVAS